MILRFLVVIPTYNNPETIGSVVADILEQTNHPILIVDDGSDTPVESLLPKSDRVRIIRHDENRGKGVALQTAMNDAVTHGFTHLLSMDGDSQHPATEIPKLVSAANENPGDLILGNRNFEAPNVPPASRFGRWFSNFWVKVETDLAISDSQSGFRIYPLFHTQNLTFFSRKFDFEIEVLIYLLWRGVRVREVDVDVKYAPPERRVSHFHKLWDNVRLTLLNTVLVLVSLLRSHSSLRQVCIALGMGIWIGCTPLFGFHTLLAFIVALLFRLNFIVVWLGTHVSNPIFAPVVIALSVTVGKWLLSKSAGTIAGFAQDWLIGSLVVGGLLGALVGMLAYLSGLLIRRRISRPQRSWTGKSRGGRFGVWCIKTVAQKLGLRTAYACLYFIVPYFYFFAPNGRRACNEYWKIISPTDSFLKRQLNIVRQFRKFGQLLLDRIFQSFFSKPQFKTNPNGMEHILEVATQKKGAVLITAHCGAWDLGTAALPVDGLKGNFYLAKYQADGFTVEQMREHGRTEHIKSIATNENARSVLAIREVLLNGGVVGLMADRPMSGQHELIPFLGKLAPFDPTPFRIAALCNAPVVFSFGFKAASDTYDFYAFPPKHLQFKEELSHEAQCYEWLTEFVRQLEPLIRRYPDQWANYYPFWSSTPVSFVQKEESKLQNN